MRQHRAQFYTHVNVSSAVKMYGPRIFCLAPIGAQGMLTNLSIAPNLHHSGTNLQSDFKSILFGVRKSESKILCL